MKTKPLHASEKKADAGRSETVDSLINPFGKTLFKGQDPMQISSPKEGGGGGGCSSSSSCSGASAPEVEKNWLQKHKPAKHITFVACIKKEHTRCHQIQIKIYLIG